MSSEKGAHQTVLQRKIFSRWINQKLIPHKYEPIKDCVTDFADGVALIHLMEVLSESKNPDQKFKPQTARMQQIDQASRALAFVWACGVEMKLKPSAENLVDQNEQPILALVWAIMLKYLKFSDDQDEEKLSAEDALLMWVRNQVSSKGVVVDSFAKSFNDGLAFCAILNKFRPKVVDFDKCSKDDPAGNLRTAFAAAEKCFGLEQYLTPEDIAILDPKSMVIYVSEYYIGAAQMRKMDLAARRITKLVAYTRTNDLLRSEYQAGAQPLRTRLDDALGRLKEHTIHNTMAGARANLEAFEKYKATEKGSNIGDFLRLEAVFNNLARRLADHHRPQYVPGDNLVPVDFAKTLLEIEEAEKVKSKALHDELNRQIRLANLYVQHQARSAKISAWTAEKLKYLNVKELVDSSGSAKYFLNRHAAYINEAEATKSRSWEALKKQGGELVEEKFEHGAAVQAAEAEISNALTEMDKLSQQKQAVLDDDLQRELYKEKINLVAEQHENRFGTLESWIKDKLDYTAKKEDIGSVSDAQLQLSLLAAYESNKQDLTSTAVPALKELGKTVLDSEYKTDLSNWEYPKKAEIRARESYVDQSWETLSKNSAQKKAILEDDLAREKFKEEIRLCVLEHVDRHAKLDAWVQAKEAYLDVKEEIDTVDKAQLALQVLSAYDNDKADLSKTSVPSLKSLGNRIVTAEYKTDLSEWKSPDIQQVQAREAHIDEKWALLSTKSAAKQAFLDAELARELKKEELRLQIANLGGDFILWSSTALEDVKGSQFGFLLEEVEAYGRALEESNKIIESDGNAKLQAYNNVYEEAKTIGVKDNRYTTLEPQNLQSSFDSLKEAVAQRTASYEQELARQRANDALDKEFSQVVNQIIRTIDTHREEISKSTKDLSEQLAFVQERLEEKSLSDQLPKVQELNDKIQAAGFSVRHTTNSALDVTISHDNYLVFLNAKAKSLAEEIKHRELRGVSPEEYEQIDAQFRFFDKNSNGVLDAKEFKACLYSLGEEKDKKEVLEVIAKYGGTNSISTDQFKEFMITQLGDTDTKDEIVEGFSLINKGPTAAKPDLLLELMKDEDVAYIVQEAPKSGDDYDYKAWTETVFSR